MPKHKLTSKHIPQEYKLNSDNLFVFIVAEFPNLAMRQDFCMGIVNELATLSLTTYDLSPILLGDSSGLAKAEENAFTTPIGRQFLKYLTSPLQMP